MRPGDGPSELRLVGAVDRCIVSEAWGTDGHRSRVVDYVILSGETIASADDFHRLAVAARRRPRDPLRPVTLDFDPAEDPALYARAQAAVEKANIQFGFHLDRWQQPLRFNVYSEGQRFLWHMDHTAHDNSKLAMIHPICAAERGGALYLLLGGTATRVDVPLGSTVVFPAFVPHCVSTVTQGARVVLAGWASGDPFR